MTSGESNNKNNSAHDPSVTKGMMWGAGVGVALGAGIGAALGNIAIGAGAGVALGTGIGMMLGMMKKK